MAVSPVRRRTDAVGPSSGRDAIIDFIGALVAEQADERADGRLNLVLEILAFGRLGSVLSTGFESVADPYALAAGLVESLTAHRGT